MTFDDSAQRVQRCVLKAARGRAALESAAHKMHYHRPVNDPASVGAAPRWESRDHSTTGKHRITYRQRRTADGASFDVPLTGAQPIRRDYGSNWIVTPL